MKVVLILVGAALLLVGLSAIPSSSRSVEAAEDRTNVLILVTDDQRYDSLLVMPKTERLLTNKGVGFTNAFATTPACCPSRASIFTGQYVHNHGVKTNDGTTTVDLDHSTTLQARLQAQGYKTALFGKYLNGWGVENPPPYFDRWAVMSGISDLYYYNNTWNIDGRHKTVSRYSTHFIEKQASEFISSRAALRNPWLTYVTFTAPHAPFRPERKYRRAPVPPFTPDPAVLERDRSDKPPWVQERQTPLEVVKRQRRGQLRTLMSVDDAIARIIRVLRETGQARNTLVFFISDNGYLLGEHSLQGKTTPYMPSVRVPLLLRWPSGVPQGVTDDRLVANIDIAPTVMDALDLPVDPSEMDGRSLLDQTWERDRLLLEYWARPSRNTPDWGGMITADHQYIEYYEDEDFGGEPIFAEYYNISVDPYQLENLIPPVPEHPITLPLVSQQLDADRNCRGTEGPQACP